MERDMLVFPQVDPTNFFLRKFNPRGPLTFKMETKQELQEEEIPIQAMAALKNSRKHRPWRHQPYDIPSWGQIKTLTNQVKNLISCKWVECPKDKDWLNGYKSKTPIYVVYKRPTSEQGTHTD